MGANDSANELVIQGDSRIVVASDGFSLVRYNANGSLDDTFDSDGLLTIQIADGGDATSLALQADGGIVAGGYAWSSGTQDFAAARVMPGGIPDKTAHEDAAFSFTFAVNTFTDPDGDTLTYAASRSDGSVLPAWLSFDATTRTFSGTPANGDVGTVDVKVTATDTGSLSASDIFTIPIGNTNDAPTLANPIGDLQAPVVTSFSFKKPRLKKSYIVLICLFFFLIGAAYVYKRRGIPFVTKREQWTIGIYRSNSPFQFNELQGWTNPLFRAENVTDVPAKFVADPFLVREGDIWNLFFEVYNNDTRQGDLAVAPPVKIPGSGIIKRLFSTNRSTFPIPTCSGRMGHII